MNKSMMKEEVTKHLTENIIPFWKALRDDTYGGYYGYMDYNLNVDKTAEKGCILNSRITWFFANAYILLACPDATHHTKKLCPLCHIAVHTA